MSKTVYIISEYKHNFPYEERNRIERGCSIEGGCCDTERYATKEEAQKKFKALEATIIEHKNEDEHSLEVKEYHLEKWKCTEEDEVVELEDTLDVAPFTITVTNKDGKEKYFNSYMAAEQYAMAKEGKIILNN